MSELIAHCLGTDNGVSCAERVTEVIPVPLCTRHRMEVAVSIVPEMLASAMGFMADGDLAENATAVPPDFGGSHASRVYFIVNGNRVKIGVTTNLKGRLYSLSQPQESVALTLVGDKALEADLHEQFDDFRVGSSEWFNMTPEIQKYMASKARSSGLPGLVPRARRVSDEEIIAALHHVAGPNVYLTDVAKHLGMPYRQTRKRVEALGVLVRRAVRNGVSTGVGVHREDLPPLVAQSA